MYAAKGLSAQFGISIQQGWFTMTAPQESDSQQQIEALNQQIQELQAALMQTQKLSSVGALASSITHEFNNILTTVINYAKMGLRHTDEKTREKAFNKILAAGQRASKITCGMLSFARQQGTRREPTDVVQLVKSVMVLVEKDLQGAAVIDFERGDYVVMRR